MGGRMTRGRWLFVAAVVIVIVFGGISLGRPPGEAARITPSVTPSIAAIASASTIPLPTPTVAPSPSSAPTATPDPTATPTETDPPTASGDPRLLYAAFLLRVNDDRSKVTDLNERLADAAQVPNLKAVKSAAVDILDFVDTERDWLTAHPPAGCYADAHRAARRMLAAYASAAEAFNTWAGTGGGLAGAGALLDALDAADRAGTALSTFGTTIETTRCLA